jgi:hypothetical protein
MQQVPAIVGWSRGVWGGIADSEADQLSAANLADVKAWAERMP